MRHKFNERRDETLQDRLEDIARQLMESFMHSRNREKMLHHRGAFGNKPGEIMVLHLIYCGAKDGSPGLMVSEISGRLNVTSPTVTQHIRSLEEKGLVERHFDRGDRRIVRVRPTEKGIQYIQRVNEARLKLFTGLVKHLGENESLRFIETMRKISDYLHARTETWMGHEDAKGDDVV